MASRLAAEPKAEIPKQKGTLIFAVDSLSARTMDPILEGRPGNAVYQAAMYDSLVWFDTKKGGLGPGVAESWDLSDDGLTWTFHLRPDQKFHNGDKLIAVDVKFSLERQMSPESLSSAKATLKRIIKDIEAADELTVKIRTNGPQISLPAMLSRAVAPEGAIMPKNYIEKIGVEEFRKKPIGSGPWKFVRSVPGDRIEFEAVDYPHWRGTPHFKNLQIPLVPEESARVSMARTGEARIVSIGPETMRSAARSGLEVVAVPGTMQAIFQVWGTYRPDQKDIQAQTNVAYLLVAHDLATVRHMADYTAVMYLGKIVEYGPTEHLFDNVAHPYTKALFSAVLLPRPDERPGEHEEEIVLSGEVPSPLNPPSGCRFHTRCPFVMDRCAREEPPAVEIAPGHVASCHLHTGAAMGAFSGEDAARGEAAIPAPAG